MLEEQLRFSKTQNAQLIEQNARQAELISRMASQIETLTASVHSLEQALLSRDASLEQALVTKRALGKLISNKSEKIVTAPPPCSPSDETPPKKVAPSAKERTHSGWSLRFSGTCQARAGNRTVKDKCRVPALPCQNAPCAWRYCYHVPWRRGLLFLGVSHLMANREVGL